MFFGIDLLMIKSPIKKWEKFINEFNKYNDYFSIKVEYNRNYKDGTLKSSHIKSIEDRVLIMIL